MKKTPKNLNNMEYIGNGVWRKKYGNKYSYYIECQSRKTCQEPYLTIRHHPGSFCSYSCANTMEYHALYGKKGKDSPNFGRKTSETTKNKLAKINRGKTLSKETKRKIKNSLVGKKCYNWKGGISKEPYCFNWTKEVVKRQHQLYKKEV